VHLQGAHGAGDDHAARREPAVAADDVHELLGAQVGGKAALGDHVVGELHGHLVGDDRVVALGDVGEGAGVHQARVALQGLHQVRLDRVLQEHGHAAGCLDVLSRERLALGAIAEGDAPEALAQVPERGGEAEDGHHFARHRDVVAGLARDAVELAAEPVDDLPHGTVVEIDDAPPRDRQRVDLELVAVHQMGVDHRRQQVVGDTYGVDVAGEMQVEVFHRDELRVAAAGGAALDAEDRAERGFAQSEHDLLAVLRHGLGDADGGDGLALTQWRRRDGRDVDDLGVGPGGETLEDGHVVDLGLVAAVQLEFVLEDAGLGGDLLDGFEGGSLGDLDV